MSCSSASNEVKPTLLVSSGHLFDFLICLISCFISRLRGGKKKDNRPDKFYFLADCKTDVLVYLFIYNAWSVLNDVNTNNLLFTELLDLYVCFLFVFLEAGYVFIFHGHS